MTAGRRAKAWVAFLPLVLATTLACAIAPTGPKGLTWRFLPGHVESLRYAPFRDGRQCWIYLPPGYSTSDRHYPVLYVNDGEIAFDGTVGMHINRICEDLIRRGEIEPLIVVAIENGPGHQRFIDYTPWPAPYWSPNGGGDFYVRAIRDTLKPEIDRRYRTLVDPSNTGMAGFSLGGLISAYAGFAYDSTFGKIGTSSASYDYAYPQMYNLVRARGRPPLLIRFYQDTGYPDDNGLHSMESALISVGFQLGLDLMSVTVQGGTHDAVSWAYRFPDLLKFLYPRKPDSIVSLSSGSHADDP